MSLNQTLVQSGEGLFLDAVVHVEAAHQDASCLTNDRWQEIDTSSYSPIQYFGDLYVLKTLQKQEVVGEGSGHAEA